MDKLKNTLEISVLKACENSELKQFNQKKYFFILNKYDQVLAGSYENGIIKTVENIGTETNENSILELRIFNEDANLFLKKSNNKLKVYKPILKNQIDKSGLYFEDKSVEIDTKFTGKHYNKLALKRFYDYDEKNKLAYIKYEYLEKLDFSKNGGNQ